MVPPLQEMVGQQPLLLWLSRERQLAPRVQHLHGLGCSSAELCQMLAAEPSVLLQSVAQHMRPVQHYLQVCSCKSHTCNHAVASPRGGEVGKC